MLFLRARGPLNFFLVPLPLCFTCRHNRLALTLSTLPRLQRTGFLVSSPSLLPFRRGLPVRYRGFPVSVPLLVGCSLPPALLSLLRFYRPGPLWKPSLGHESGVPLCSASEPPVSLIPSGQWCQSRTVYESFGQVETPQVLPMSRIQGHLNLQL